MRMCFGSYLAVLVSCKAPNVDNKVVCETLLHSVAPDYEFTYNGQVNADRVREDNSSKLRRCTLNVPPDVVKAARKANANDVAAYFKENIVCLLNETQRKQIICVLKDIIAGDAPVVVKEKVQGIGDDIKIDFVSGTTKKALAAQHDFCFSAFLAGVFLFVVTKTVNRTGKESIGDVNEAYILSFSDKTDGINLLEEEDAKKAALIAAAKQGAYDSEFAIEVAGIVTESISKLPALNQDGSEDLLMTLSSEARGRCLCCGRELGASLRRKKAKSNCKIVYVKFSPDEAESYENAVALCRDDCAELIGLMTDDEKKALLESKRRTAEIHAFLTRISGMRFKKEIEAVLRKIHEVKNDPNLPKTKLKDLKEIKEKINEPYLQEKIDASMTRMYKTVLSICSRLEQENVINTQIFGDMMKAAQGILSSEVAEKTEIIDPQGYVTRLLVENLCAQVGQDYSDACDVIVGYLVKRCDLFNETAKQS